MTPALPYWLQILGALLTPTIAIAAICIGILQWRTAHQRAVLDLFDRRMVAYSEIREVIGKIARHGTAPNDIFFEYSRAIDVAPFLFGPEVAKYLDELRNHLIDLDLANTMMAARDADHASWVQRRHVAFREVTKFYDKFIPLISPYLRAHQKAPPF